MTISSSTRKAGPAEGNGVTDTIPFTFKVFTEADIVVVQRVTATDVETTLALTTDYTVSLNSDQNADPGGDIVIVDPATDWPTGTTITVTSELSPTQAADITNLGGFYASVINAALDKLTILVQQVKGLADRSLKFPISDSGYVSTMPGKAELANNVLAFDSNGDPVAGPGATNMQALIDAAESVLADSNAGAVSYSGPDLVGTNVDAALDNAGARIVSLETDLNTAETNITNLITLSGVAANSENLGTFTGTIIQNDRTIKQALQDLETRAELSTSGTITPTFTNITNITSSSAGVLHYIRVGSYVNFVVYAFIDPTSTGNTILHIDPPIASDFTLSTNVIGTATSTGGAENAVVLADTASDKIELRWTTADTAARGWAISGIYKIN